MSVRLDWQIGDDGTQPSRRKRGRWPTTSLLALILALLLVAILLSIWQSSRNKSKQAENRLIEQIQRSLDLERHALLKGDGDLFFDAQDRDPAWLSAQLLPENQAVYRAGQTVTGIEQSGEDIWVNLGWTQDGHQLQRVAFFRQRQDRLIHIASSETFWGPVTISNQPWGVLRYHERDSQWVWAMVALIDQLVNDICDQSIPVPISPSNRSSDTVAGNGADVTGATSHCLPGKIPFTLSIAGDFRGTAAPNHIRIPSPRLLALDEDGNPADLYWGRLRRELEAYLTPALIQFAVPTELTRIYRAAAQAFMAQSDEVVVEIIDLDELPADPLQWPAGVDGAALTPTEEMLAAGFVRDLTNYVESDPTFNQGDFYKQIWQGAQWRDRMFFVPQTATMRLIYYDKVAYNQAGLDEPSSGWTWQDLDRDMIALDNTLPGLMDAKQQVIYLDAGLDTLFSYAYTHNSVCNGSTVGDCPTQLGVDDTTAALEWYRSLILQTRMLPDLTQLSPSERQRSLLNLQSALSVDNPVIYENRLLMYPLGVVPFPGSDTGASTAPLWINGSFIRQDTSRPLAVWKWLNFLSYHLLQPSRRLIPSRPSVAAAVQFWSSLPPTLGEVMRAAFPSAKPVTLEDQKLITWEQLAAVASGRQTPIEAAQTPPRLTWFQSPR